MTDFKLIAYNLIVRPFLFKRPKYDKKYNVSICSIFKNEGPFLLEWLTFHEIVGVDHFYMYDNGSDDNCKEIIQPFIDKGVVTLIDWPYHQGQISAYEHFYENYRGETQWVSFLDLDEFIVPTKDATILEWIKRYDRRPVHFINWKSFGSSGKLEHDYDKLVIEQYTVSRMDLNIFGKCIVNTDYDIAGFDITIIHEPRIIYRIFGIFKTVLPPIDQFGYFYKIKSNCNSLKRLLNPNGVEIQINHYGKAWEIYDIKRSKGDSVFEKNPRIDFEYFLSHERRYTSCDYTVFRFIAQVKLKINNIETEFAAKEDK